MQLFPSSNKIKVKVKFCLWTLFVGKLSLYHRKGRQIWMLVIFWYSAMVLAFLDVISGYTGLHEFYH